MRLRTRINAGRADFAWGFISVPLELFRSELSKDTRLKGRRVESKGFLAAWRQISASASRACAIIWAKRHSDSPCREPATCPAAPGVALVGRDPGSWWQRLNTGKILRAPWRVTLQLLMWKGKIRQCVGRAGGTGGRSGGEGARQGVGESTAGGAEWDRGRRWGGTGRGRGVVCSAEMSFKEQSEAGYLELRSPRNA